jgi:hypothetical protein
LSRSPRYTGTRENRCSRSSASSAAHPLDERAPARVEGRLLVLVDRAIRREAEDARRREPRVAREPSGDGHRRPLEGTAQHGDEPRDDVARTRGHRVRDEESEHRGDELAHEVRCAARERCRRPGGQRTRRERDPGRRCGRDGGAELAGHEEGQPEPPWAPRRSAGAEQPGRVRRAQHREHAERERQDERRHVDRHRAK